MSTDLKEVPCELTELNKKFDLLIQGLIASGRLRNVSIVFPSIGASGASDSHENEADLVKTVTKFISGSGTYTPPANCTHIRVRMWGAGGGGRNGRDRRKIIFETIYS